MEEINPERINTKEKIKIDRFLCGICQNVLISPRKCSKCPKHFCDICSSAYIETNESCPACNQMFVLKDAEHYLIEDLKEIPIECKNKHLGCKEIVIYSALSTHEDDCNFNIKNNEEKVKTLAFVETYVSNNFTLIEKKLNKITNDLKEIKETNASSINNLEKKINSLHDMLFNFISQQRKNDNFSRDFEENYHQINKGKFQEVNSQNKSNNRHSQEPPSQNNSNIKINNTNTTIDKSPISPSKSPIRSIDLEQNVINSNKRTNLNVNNIPPKDKRDMQPSAQVEIKDKCLYVYFCKGKKKGCKSSGDVWGSNPYTIDTDLCRAGLHSGLSNENGGLYIIAYGGPFNNFVPSSKNGIMSNSWEESQDIHFSVTNINNYPFETSRMNYDKCGLYIGLCMGKQNGCCQSGLVYGNNPYTSESNLCNSALHSGIINGYGGMFGIHLGGQVNKFPGSSNNGITSEKNGFSPTSYTIKPFK